MIIQKDIWNMYGKARSWPSSPEMIKTNGDHMPSIINFIILPQNIKTAGNKIVITGSNQKKLFVPSWLSLVPFFSKGMEEVGMRGVSREGFGSQAWAGMAKDVRESFALACALVT